MMNHLTSSQIDLEETLSRFIVQKSHFSRMNKRVKVQAFKPADPTPERPVRQLSVYRTANCSENEIWSIADEYVTTLLPNKKPIFARGELKCKAVLEQDLLLDPDGYPHPRHSNIINWPEDEALREAKALELSRKAQLHLR